MRFYLTNSTAPYSPSGTPAPWSDSASVFTRYLSTTKAGSATAGTALSETSTSSTWTVRMVRAISDPFTDAGTLTGNWSAVLGALESNAAANMHLTLYVWVTVGDSDTVRGTFAPFTYSADEMPTVAAGVAVSGTGSSVSCQAGDRLVVEIGYQARNTVSTSYSGRYYRGGTGSTDLIAGSTNVTTQPGWIDLPAEILFGLSSDQPPTVNAGADVVGHLAGTEFTRTAIEDDNGSAITARAWSIVSGPVGAGTTIGSAAALSWTPTTVGDYVLRYSATNEFGTGTNDLSIAVVAPSPPGDYWINEGDPGPTNVGSGSFTLATEFYVTEPCDATAIRWPRPTTDVNPTAARILTITNGVLAEITSPPGSGTGWQQTSLSEPLELTPGTRYKVAVHYLNSYSTGQAWPGGDIVNGPLVCPSNANATGTSTTTYTSGTTIGSPTTSIDANYWSDVVVTVPDTAVPVATDQLLPFFT